MTEQQLKEAIFLNEKIKRLKDIIERWEKSNLYGKALIEIETEVGGVHYDAYIGDIISFQELKKMAIERLTKRLEDCTNKFKNM